LPLSRHRSDEPRCTQGEVARRTRRRSIGERLRRERGLSQRDLSEPGISYAYISRIEAGARQPSVKALRLLPRKLGVSPDYLETGIELGAAQRRDLELAGAELRLRLENDPAGTREQLQRRLGDALAAGDLPAQTRARISLGLLAAEQGGTARRSSSSSSCSGRAR
jgi:transcriptional regulator with XRE-family HTH domain